MIPRKPAVILRMPPPLDPPPEDDPPDPTSWLAPVKPAPEMDPLPLEWPGLPNPLRRPEPEPEPIQPAPTRRPPHSDSYRAAKSFAKMAVEILNGYRAPSQLRPLAHPHHFNDISDQVLRRTVRLRMAAGRAASKGTLVRIRRLLVNEPLDGIAEGVVVLEHGESTWAMALRFERENRPHYGVLGWVCTLVQVL
ncbi:Rv3235 family protein [Dactylosporangium sp. NPDC051541]|uniref:Rv3235 family protein n=1 Tax=Dactylosporangium sp. NPDC051541 TaxID=3363977 RepID=UPI00379DC6D5